MARSNSLVLFCGHFTTYVMAKEVSSQYFNYADTKNIRTYFMYFTQRNLTFFLYGSTLVVRVLISNLFASESHALPLSNHSQFLYGYHLPIVIHHKLLMVSVEESFKFDGVFQYQARSLLLW